MGPYGDDQIGRVLGARYRLIAPVGAGASATVYQADDVQLRRPVAVKLLHPSLASDHSFLKRFRAEAQQAAALSHPNIMAVFDWGEDQGFPYLVLEYLAGGSLRAMIERGRLLTPSQAVIVALDGARGLDYAHKRGVVHRDIKPANLLFSEDGRLRIGDFGLARAINEASWTEPDGMMLGTARYASPEQATGKPLTGKTDVYSLTLSMVEAVTGVVPFSGDTTVATLMNRLGKLMPVSAELGPLAPVMERSGRPDPDERSDAGELARALLQAAERLPRPAALPLVITAARVRDDTAVAPVAAGAGRSVFTLEPAPEVGTHSAAQPAPKSPVLTPAGIGNDDWPEPGNVASKPATGGISEPDGWSDVSPYVTARRPKRRKLGRGALVGIALLVLALIVGAGAVLVRGGSIKAYAVTSMVGLQRGEAENLVNPYEWAIVVREEKSDQYPTPGQVIRHEPNAGTLKQGGEIILWVSTGPTLSALPDLVGKPKDDAIKRLDALQLLPNVLGETHDEVVPSGSVIAWNANGQNLQPGVEVPKGTTVNLLVSSGSAPRQVPEIRSMNFEDARAKVESVQLKAARQDDIFSDRWPVGIVARIEPGVGTELPRDSEVKISISKGQDLVEVPNIYGASQAKASELLAAVGLNGVVEGPINRPVLAMDPPPGTKIRRGETVNIRLG